MAGLSKDEARKERARKHSRRGETCEGCGRVVFGNGRSSHYRRCQPYILLHGWTFNEAESAALRQMAREATDHLPDSERSDAWLAFLRQARMAEARSRGLLPKDSRAIEDGA